MRDGDLLILRGAEVQALLAGRELELIHTVQLAYEAHGQGNSSLPHSTFLRFPNNQKDRIIALPAYLGAGWEAAGIKWVASFPDNLQRGLPRASALVVLNSARTGRPEAILEGSLISAKRTAASAALAAQHLHSSEPDRLGLIGCGLINFEITRFLRAVWPGLRRFIIYDLDAARAEQFRRNCQQEFGAVEVESAGEVNAVLGNASLISLATTASAPHLDELTAVRPGGVILHISLRDLAPQVILSCENVVDDIDHVCRAQTSLHLTEQLTGGRAFIRGTLADILAGRIAPRSEPERLAVFSPFGLGVLDLAVSTLVRDWGLQQGKGAMIGSFLPE